MERANFGSQPSGQNKLKKNGILYARKVRYPNFGIILDWFHLVKKCKELLSMAMKGRLIRNQVLREIMPLLWHGLTDRAIALLEQIEPEKIKDNEEHTKLLVP